MNSLNFSGASHITASIHVASIFNASTDEVFFRNRDVSIEPVAAISFHPCVSDLLEKNDCSNLAWPWRLLIALSLSATVITSLVTNRNEPASNSAPDVIMVLKVANVLLRHCGGVMTSRSDWWLAVAVDMCACNALPGSWTFLLVFYQLIMFGFYLEKCFARILELDLVLQSNRECFTPWIGQVAWLKWGICTIFRLVFIFFSVSI